MGLMAKVETIAQKKSTGSLKLMYDHMHELKVKNVKWFIIYVYFRGDGVGKSASQVRIM